MYLSATFESMFRQFPQEMERIMENLRKSKSKNRLADMKDLTWGFTSVDHIHGGSMSLADVLSGKPRQPTTYTTHYYVEGKIGRWSGSASIDRVPEEAAAAKKQQEEMARLEKEKHDSLSDEEKSAKKEAMLKELSKYPGFMAIGIK